MQHRTSQLRKYIFRIGVGLTISATGAVSQVNAQLVTNLNDLPSIAQLNQDSVQLEPTSVLETNLNRYSVDLDDNLCGQIATAGGNASDMTVVLMQNQSVVSEVKTNVAGEFQVPKVAPGRYSIIVAGNNEMAARGVLVEPATNLQAEKFINLTTIRTQFDGVRELAVKALPNQIASQISGSAATVAGEQSDLDISNQVRIINGQLQGQVASLIKQENASGVQVHLISQDRPVAQVETDAEGQFSIPDVQAGIYDLVAAGESGFAAMRIQAVANGPIQVVAYRKLAPIALAIQLAEDCPCNQAAPAVESAVQAPIEYASESLGCGGACGGVGATQGNFAGLARPLLRGRSGGFGGGLLGGGGRALGGAGVLRGSGGLGRLIALGGAAGGIVAIAVDGDDDPAPATPTGE